MGMTITNLGDLGYDHEGTIAHVLDDGTHTTSSTPQTRPRMTGELRAVCECGWTGAKTWRTDADTPDGWPSEDLEDEILAEWEAHVHAVAKKAGITPTKHVEVDHRAAADKALRAWRDAATVAVNTVANAGPAAAWPFPADVDDALGVAAEVLPYLRHLLDAAQHRLTELALSDARLRTTATAPAGTVALGASLHLTGIIAVLEQQEKALNAVRAQTCTLGYTWVDTGEDDED